LLGFAYNTSVHSSTSETPFFLNYLRDPQLPIRAVEVQSALKVAGFRQEEAANTGRKETKYMPGDRVWLWKPDTAKGHKIRPGWHGPYRVLAVGANGVVTISGRQGRWKAVPVHAALLRPFRDPELRPVQPAEFRELQKWQMEDDPFDLPPRPTDGDVSADRAGESQEEQPTPLKRRRVITETQGSATQEEREPQTVTSQREERRVPTEKGKGDRGIKEAGEGEGEEVRSQQKETRQVGEQQSRGIGPQQQAVLWTRGAATPTLTPQAMDAGAEILTVEYVVDAEDDTWEPEENCAGCREAIDEYLSAQTRMGRQIPQRCSDAVSSQRPPDWREEEAQAPAATAKVRAGSSQPSFGRSKCNGRRKRK
jgi:hypothetical protein